MVGALSFVDGREGKVVLMGNSEEPEGVAIVLVMPDAGGENAATVPFREGLALLHPAAAIDILCMHERTFGRSGLTAPAAVAGQA